MRAQSRLPQAVADVEGQWHQRLGEEGGQGICLH